MKVISCFCMKLGKKAIIHSIIPVVIILLLVLSISSCETTHSRYKIEDKHGDTEIIIRINVNSEPSGAKVFADEVFQGKTPITLTFKAHAYYSARNVWVVDSKGNAGIPIGHGPESWNTIRIKSIKTTLKVYKEDYQLKTRYYSKIPSEDDVRHKWRHREGTRPTPLTINYNWTAFLKKSAGPSIDLRLKVKPQQ